MRKLAKPDIRFWRKGMSALRRIALGACLFSGLVSAALIPRAEAQCINCECNGLAHEDTRQFITQQHNITRLFITEQFVEFRNVFWLPFFWQQNLLAAMRGMSEQLVTTGMLQVEAFGAILDAKNQLETQQIMQQMVAKAHKDYAPDTEMCTLGTASRGLGSAYRNGVYAAHLLAKRMQDRQLGNGQTMGAGGIAVDKDSRFDQIRDVFCDNEDHFKAMDAICRIKRPQQSVNKDINFTETVLRPLTIETDFNDNDVANVNNANERDFFAMASNLYGPTNIDFLQEQYFRNPFNHSSYLDIREIVAKRNVAEYSFDNIAGMKVSDSQPAQEIGNYIEKVYAQLGFKDDDPRKMVGQRPSYNALMEIMNKTLYLRPEFYINLYTKPANIQRIGATIRAANLMQGMDQFNSMLRTEMNLSQILESEVTNIQERVQGRLDRIKPAGMQQQKPGP